MSKSHFKGSLFATTIIAGMAIAAPAYGQAAAPPPSGQTTPPEDSSGPNPGTSAPQAPTTAGDEIIITGSLLPRTSRETPSPVTVLSAEALSQRGINTV